uniref:Uncharacterized protein n=1 Tax=Anguilla anguilla TaxID=7936 RepID=A0A0E9PIG8_ANGAN
MILVFYMHSICNENLTGGLHSVVQCAGFHTVFRQLCMIP